MKYELTETQLKNELVEIITGSNENNLNYILTLSLRPRLRHDD